MRALKGHPRGWPFFTAWRADSRYDTRIYIGMRRTYLDWAAAAPVHPAAERAFRQALTAHGNPSSAHEEGREAKAMLDDARARIAKLAGARAENVIFASGATEANALAIRGHVRARLRAGALPSELHLLYLPSAHASVVETMKALADEGVATEPLPLVLGDVDIEAMKRLIRPGTTLVCLESVSPETGLRHDARAVKAALPQGVALHVDASQSPLFEALERTRWGADLVSLDAQKAGGIRGIGCLIVSPSVPLEAVMEGGGQERGLRSGTPSPALACAFAAALEECARVRESFAAKAERMRARLAERVLGAAEGVHVNEGRKNAPHILNLSFIGIDTDYLQALLDRDGFAVATKSACETDSPDGSRAVLALSCDPARASSTLRVSWGPRTRERDLDRFAEALVRAVSFQKAHKV